jgi:hypothetical protein
MILGRSAIAIILSAFVIFIVVRFMNRFSTKMQLGLTVPIVLGHIVVLIWKPHLILLSNFAVLLAAASLGNLIGIILKTESSLITFMITASLVDILSFSGGLTRRIISDYVQNKNMLLQFLCFSLPVKGRIIPVVGIGDLVIMAAVFRALLTFQVPDWQNFLVPVTGLIAALFVGLAVGGVYALPFICAAVVLFLLYRNWLKNRSNHGS